MRLTANQRQAIVESIGETFGADDNKFGGDIDLLVEVPRGDDQTLERKIRAVGRIQRKIGEQKIDLIVTDGSEAQEAPLVVKNSRKHGILLG